jgi:16S rRNA (uracil1498-N3)-methyltransferase
MQLPVENKIYVPSIIEESRKIGAEMHRFFVQPEAVQADEIHFSPETSRQINHVLRLRSGSRVIVLDNTGYEIQTDLIDVNDAGCVGRVVQKEECRTEPQTKLLMILSLTQREKFEWMLQKCTEVGASVFLPMITSRSLSQKKSDVSSKYVRWNTILKEAAEQSGRGIIPQLLDAEDFDKVIKNITQDYSLCLMAWESEHQKKLDDLLREHRAEKIAVMIGPEGGFAEEEVKRAADAGFHPVTLGKRILRMETAAVVAAALVLHAVEKD